MRACVRFLRGADGVGTEAVSKTGGGGVGRHPAARGAEVDFYRSQSDRASRLREGAFHGADPAAAAMVWAGDGVAGG